VAHLHQTGVTFWRNIVDSLSDAIVVLSADLQPTALNPAAETLLGVSKANAAFIEELLARNEWLARMVDLSLNSGQNLADPEAVLSLQRRSIVVRAEVSPLMENDGRIRGAIILLQDLAHQKSAERILEAGEPTLRLSPAGLAHEVKNPLTGIKGAAELLAAMFRNDSRAQSYCNVILEGVNRIASLVEEVLAFGSPQRLAAKPVNIHRVLHHALRMAGLHPSVPAGIRVEQLFDPSLPDVVGDAPALERVFLNLIRNAVEAIDSRGAILLSTRMESQFRMTAEGRRRHFLRVEISDSGQGLSDEQMAQLFTPFFTTKPHGTGLGLVISQRIVALHGGKLWAERGGLAAAVREDRDDPLPSDSAKRQAPSGMTFKVTLPVRTDSGAGS
jgi:two-component system, NtrC family, nitrogen regulation sensor histidine kinase GlnL